MDKNQIPAVESKMDIVVSYILRTGLLLSLLFLIIGLAWKWWITGQFYSDYALSKSNVL